ncbi:MAG: hypothetical protein WCS31_13830 [Verrucomicrobiae bacterium]
MTSLRENRRGSKAAPKELLASGRRVAYGFFMTIPLVALVMPGWREMVLADKTA